MKTSKTFVLAAIMIMCGLIVASQAEEKQNPTGPEGGGAAPQGPSTTTTSKAPSTTTKPPLKQTAEEQCALECRSTKGCGSSATSAPTANPTQGALGGAAGYDTQTGLQPGGCKEYQMCMAQCINAVNANK